MANRANQNGDARRKLLNDQLAQAAEEDRQASFGSDATPDGVTQLRVARSWLDTKHADNETAFTTAFDLAWLATRDPRIADLPDGSARYSNRGELLRIIDEWINRSDRARQASEGATIGPPVRYVLYVGNCRWSEYSTLPIEEHSFDTHGERDAFIEGFWTALNWDENDKRIAETIEEAAKWARIDD